MRISTDEAPARPKGAHHQRAPRRHGREGVKAGRTLEDALAELNDVLARVDKQGDDVADIRRWLQDSV